MATGPATGVGSARLALNSDPPGPILAGTAAHVPGRRTQVEDRTTCPIGAGLVP